MIETTKYAEQLCYIPALPQLYPTIGTIRVRAASAGFSNERMQFLQKYLGYALPDGTDRNAIQPGETPICLLFTKMPNGERLLVHKTSIKKDTFGRPGAYFIHLLAALPPEFSARDAIGYWRSPFWKKSDDDLKNLGIALPSVALDGLKKAVPRPDFQSVRDALPFVIHAYLTRQPRQRLYIAAPTEQVAWLLVSLTRCLPLPLLEPLTFSTYEHDLHSRDLPLVVGTCWLPDQGNRIQDLPMQCYTTNLAINCYAPRTSPLKDHPAAKAFAHKATDILQETGGSRVAALNDLIRRFDTISDLSVETFLEEALLSFVSQENTDTLVKPPQEGWTERLKPNVADILRQFDLARTYLKDADVRHAIFDHALGDEKWWPDKGKPALSALRRQAEEQVAQEILQALSELAYHTTGEVIYAMKHENEKRQIVTLIELAACASPAVKEPQLWNGLLRRLSADRDILNFAMSNWDIRSPLLTQWTSIAAHIDEKHIRSWLMVSWKDFGELLLLHLPDSWYNMPLSMLLANSPAAPIPQTAMERMKSAHPSFIENQFGLLLANSRQAKLATPFLLKLLEKGYADKRELLHWHARIIQQTKQIDAAVEKIMKSVSLSTEDIAHFVEQDGVQLLGYYRQSIVLCTCIQRYLQGFSADDLDRPAAREALKTIHDMLSPQLSTNERTLVDNWYSISIHSGQVKISRQELDTLARSIDHFRSSWTRTKLLEKVASSLATQVESDVDLCSILFSLGSKLPKEETLQFFLQMIKMVGERYERRRVVADLLPYVRVALQIGSLYDISTEKQEREMKRLLHTLLSFVSAKEYLALDKLAQEWPPRLRQLWHVYGKREM